MLENGSTLDHTRHLIMLVLERMVRSIWKSVLQEQVVIMYFTSEDYTLPTHQILHFAVSLLLFQVFCIYIGYFLPQRREVGVGYGSTKAPFFADSAVYYIGGRTGGGGGGGCGGVCGGVWHLGHVPTFKNAGTFSPHFT